jgi:ketosteroid isomerase-like protein
MSQQNVELVIRWYAFLPDLGCLDPADDQAVLDEAFRDYLDESYETRLPADYPEGEPVFRGREGLAEFAAMLRDAWSEWRFEPEGFIDAGDRVLVFMRVVAKGRASEAPIERTSTQVVTICDGRLTSTRVYRDCSEALKAAGLEG